MGLSIWNPPDPPGPRPTENPMTQRRNVRRAGVVGHEAEGQARGPVVTLSSKSVTSASSTVQRFSAGVGLTVQCARRRRGQRDSWLGRWLDR
jgi:hypothetical protein